MTDGRRVPGEPARPDGATLVTGLVFLALGVAFLAEAGGAWTFRLSHLGVAGPVALIVVGAAVLAAALVDRPQDPRLPPDRPQS